MGIENHPDVRRLGALLAALASHHPRGILILLGSGRPPEAGEWSELLSFARADPGEAGRVDGSRNTDSFFWGLAKGLDAEREIEKAGGWNSVVESALHFRECSPTDWNLFVEAVRVKSSPLKSRIGEPPMEGISRKYGVSPKTVLRRLQRVPLAIAAGSFGGYWKLFSEGGDAGGPTEGDEKKGR